MNYASHSDRELQSACREGDNEAFRALVERYELVIKMTARRFYDLSAEDAEEIFQTVATCLFLRLEKIENVNAWVFRTTLYQARKVCRDTARRRELLHEYLSSTPTESEPRDFFETTVRPHLFYKEFRRLEDRCQDLLIGIYRDGMTHREASRHFGIPAGSVFEEKAKCLKQLKHYLTNGG